MQARHHKIMIHEESETGCGLHQPFRAAFASYEILLQSNFTSSLSLDQPPSHLAKITELDLFIGSEVNLDLRHLPSLRRLWIAIQDEDAWKSLRCGQLEYVSLYDVGQDLTQLQHPISAICVSIQRCKYPERLAVGRLFPDTVHLSFKPSDTSPHDIEVDLDGSRLRHVKVSGAHCKLIATQPIHLSSVVVAAAEQVSQNITASYFRYIPNAIV